MSSDRRDDGTLDLERDLPVTPEDVVALRRVRDASMTTAEYIGLLNAMSQEPSRTVTPWEPFVLPAPR